MVVRYSCWLSSSDEDVVTSYETSLGSDAFSIAAKKASQLSAVRHTLYMLGQLHTATASGYRRRPTIAHSLCLHVRRFMSHSTIYRGGFALGLSQSSVEFQLIVGSKHVIECCSAVLTYTAPCW